MIPQCQILSLRKTAYSPYYRNNYLELFFHWRSIHLFSGISGCLVYNHRFSLSIEAYPFQLSSPGTWQVQVCLRSSSSHSEYSSYNMEFSSRSQYKSYSGAVSSIIHYLRCSLLYIIVFTTVLSSGILYLRVESPPFYMI